MTVMAVFTVMGIRHIRIKTKTNFFTAQCSAGRGYDMVSSQSVSLSVWPHYDDGVKS